MKPTHQFAVFVAALGSLLAGAASGNTPLATLPLKASALALPNVIIGMDDSGSMDWEALLDTSSGVIWWNGNSAWDTATNKPLTGDANFSPYVYLFPLGTAAGAAIYPADSRYGQAAPPIRQLAWTRSSTFNPAYYNPRVTYRPWGPAYVSGSFKTGYPDAVPTAAPSHPAVAGSPTLDLGSMWNSSNANFAATGYRFYVQQGMVLPVGTRVLSSSAAAGGTPCSGTEVDLTSEQTVGAGSACWASIPYFPATYWHAEDCTLGNDCVEQPDGTGRLKRYEIRSSMTLTNHPGGRTYVDELQNFANWFTYYRKRKLMLAAAMTEVLGDTTGLRLGVVPFNVNAMEKIVRADAADNDNNRYFTAGLFHLNSMVANGTPTHQVMKNIALQFEARNERDASKNVVQYACQRNAMFLVTDGFSNTATTEVPTYTAEARDLLPPYAVTPPGSLAELALAYYRRVLREGDLATGKVEPGDPALPNADLNTNLHINTYALTLGVRGTLWPSVTDPFAVPPAWPQPVGDTPLMIDDLWHATINGRGKMYLADTPEQTAASIRAGLQDILNGKATQGGVAVNTVNLSRSDGFAYAASYNPAGWSGDLEAFALNTTTGSVAAERTWSASAKLATKPLAERVIATWNGTGGTPFQAGTVGALANPGDRWGNTVAVMSYLRGNRAGEGTTFRARTGLLGAVINAEPVIDRENKVAYLATGEGMLHAFDVDKDRNPGNELWAYVPGRQLANMGEISAPTYSFRTRLDGTPVLRTTDSGVKLLVSGMGAAGRGYFAIDVTQPRNLTEPGLAGKVLWEFPASGDTATAAKMGQTVGKPAIVKLASGNSVVLVTSGYNNTADGKGRLWVLNASNGNIIKEFVTPDGAILAEAGLAQVSPMAEPDGSVRFVYGGDLLGNVWRFDLSMEPIAAGAVNRIAQLRDALNNPQPVTAAPELLSWQGQRIVMVGTGRLLDSSDFAKDRVHSIYTISDGAELPGSARQSLVTRTINVAGSGTIDGAPVDLKTQRGWYADLPAGEHINTRPVLAYGALAFVANQTGDKDCSASSRLYLIGALSGNKVDKASFVTSVLSATSNSSGLTALLTKDGQTIRFVTRDYADGKIIEREMSAGVPVPPAKNSWREIRR